MFLRPYHLHYVFEARRSCAFIFFIFWVIILKLLNFSCFSLLFHMCFVCFWYNTVYVYSAEQNQYLNLVDDRENKGHLVQEAQMEFQGQGTWVQRYDLIYLFCNCVVEQRNKNKKESSHTAVCFLSKTMLFQKCFEMLFQMLFQKCYIFDDAFSKMLYFQYTQFIQKNL